MGNATDTFIRAKTVATVIGVSMSQVYRLVKLDPSFPKPIRIGERINVWSRYLISDWIEANKSGPARSKEGAHEENVPQP